MDNTKQRYKELGDFLKTRRAKILPSQVGLTEGIRRRTPGLRREEVALLSGIGLTWYTWLEQGRQIQVSSQVLESLSRVLMLDKQEVIHLYTLAQQAPPASFHASNKNVNPMLQNVLDSLKYSPSMILDIRWNVIAWNRAATMVFTDFSKINICNRNLISIMFTNQNYKRLFPDWESQAKGALARFRAACGKIIEDPWLSNFIKELRSESKEFNQWWPMHDVEPDQEIFKEILHPVLGQLRFEHTSFLVAKDTNFKMYVNTPLAKEDTEKIAEYIKINQ